MAFPFWWIGALTAGLFLTAVFTLFGLALRLVGRMGSEIRGSILPGLVSGFRDWAETGGAHGGGSNRAVSPTSGNLIAELGAAATGTERVRRR